MISKLIKGRRDGRSSARDALRYGQGLSPNHETGEVLDKALRTRVGSFGLVDDGVYTSRDVEEMRELMELAASEMQANCDLNTRVADNKKIAHFMASFGLDKPSEAVLRDTEDSMLAALGLQNNHFATFFHNDNGYWHLHIVASRIDKTPSHRGNSLWHDKIKRDKVCREVEIRHGLARDNGLHEINERGEVVEIPKAQRIAAREKKQSDKNISDSARQIEKYSGEKTFQSWCNEIRIGDRLKHARSWRDLHAAAAAYGCEVKPKGAGFVIFPTGEKGGIQVSKVGLKNLQARFGVFVPADQGSSKVQPEQQYTPEPTQADTKNLYRNFSAARDSYKSVRLERRSELREQQKQERAALRAKYKTEISNIRAVTTGDDRFVKISVAKMEQAAALAALSATHERERAALFARLNDDGPGHTFRTYLEKQAAQGSAPALAAVEKYAAKDDTAVAHEREDDQLKIVARVAGRENRAVPPLPIKHSVTWLGSVKYDLGADRQIVDDRLSKLIKLNSAAVESPEAIETALRFATAKYGLKLTLSGSNQFQVQAVEIAVKKGLGVRFADPVLDKYRERLEAERAAKFTKPKQQQPQQENKHGNEQRHHKQRTRAEPPAHRRDRLHHLSEGNLVLDTSHDVGLLRQAVPGGVGQQQDGLDRDVQRALGSTSRSGAEQQRVERVDVPAGIYVGKISLDEHVVAQKVGRDERVIHYPLGSFSLEQQAMLRDAVERDRAVQVTVGKSGKINVQAIRSKARSGRS